MFLPNPIACDVCKTVKQPSNHWFYAHLSAITQATTPSFHMWPWDAEAEEPAKRYVHLCGQACAVKKLAEWMNAQSTEPKQAAAALDSVSNDHNSTDQFPKDSLS